MPRARKKLDRIRQVHSWMQSRFRTPHPTVLRFVSPEASEGSLGFVELHRGKLRISLLKTCTHQHLQDLLIHEYSHAMDWSHHRAPRPDHGPHFGVCYSEVYRAYIDEGGWKESYECKW